MTDDFLLTISGHNTFREVELDAGTTLMRVGTTPRCDVRYRADQFFSQFELELSLEPDGVWALSCSEEVYLSSDGVQRLTYQRLAHGDEFSVKYADSGATLFSVRFAINFERQRGEYDRWVDLRGLEGLTIGGLPSCNLVLGGPYVDGDLLVLQRGDDDGRLVLAEGHTRYGVLLDGRRLSAPVKLEDLTFFSVANYYFYYKAERLYFSQAADITFQNVSYEDRPSRWAGSTYPLFNRNTRVREVLPSGKIAVLDPPAKREQQRQSIVLQLLPAVGMLGITLLIRGQMMGNSASSMGLMIMSVASIGLGVVTSVVGIVSDRRRFKRESSERVEKYGAYLDAKRSEVERVRGEESAALARCYPGIPHELEMVRDFSGDLFDRRPADEDFLQLRLGTGRRLSTCQIEVKDQEALELDELAEKPRALRDEFAYLEGAPITVDLARVNALGVVGTPARRADFMRTMVVDLCSRQYESDCRLYFVVEPENAEQVMWARGLPHVRNDELNCRNIACDAESRNVLFEHLYKVLMAREETRGKEDPAPHLVVFVLDECGLKNHPLSRFIDSASELGVTFVFFEGMRELLPMGCGRIVTLERDGASGTVTDAADGSRVTAFDYETVGEADAADFARTLAPVYCEEISLEGTLTRSITLFQLFGIIAADDLDLARRWASTDVTRSLAAPIGVSKSRTVTLDLHDKADGPHGLVAGTTGSGKSEILLTYILSVATLFHPYEVSFVIIDFKGGGMANQLRSLPHLVGAITNIDGREIDRSLKSIKAELRRRQRLFADAGVNHISAYIRKYKAGEVATPLPHLVLVVDEFAELKAEQPEFMAELISAARIGRSLGVHLILATQKPSGQVNEQIWSNSRFKLCLKVQSKEDSNEVIKSPLAAEIKEPGRAYLQVGNNEVFELFQSAFSGAPEHTGDEDVREFSLFQVETSGKRVPIYQRRRPKTNESALTQLDAVVAHVAAYCASAGIGHLPSICLPPLPELINLPEDARMRDGRVPLGIYDDPDNQLQAPALFEVDNANTFIVGSSQTGKTNLLQTIVRVIAQTRTPRQAQFYIMDFASMILKNLEGLAHVGGVVLPSEDERVKNLFKLLSGELATRKRRLLEVGVSSFAAYLEAGHDDLAHLYLVIDNFSVFRELYADRYEDALVSLCRDGIACGISVIVANSVTSGFGFKYLTNFSTFIALSCNDANEYGVVFDRCRMRPKDVPGRGLCCFDKTIFEFQSYLGFAGEREVDRVAAMRTFVQRANAAANGQRARRIPTVPDDLTLDYVYENYDVPEGAVPLGLDYGTVEPVLLDLSAQFSLTVVARDERAPLTVLSALMADLRRNIFERPVELHVVDALSRPLAAWRDLPFVAGYHADYSEMGTVLDLVRERADARYARVAEQGMEALADEPYLVIVVNSREALDFVSESKELVGAYTALRKQRAQMRILFVFVVGDTSVSFSSPALLKELKEERRGIVLTNLAEHKFYDVNATVARAFKGSLERGQAYLVSGQDVSKMRLAAAREGE